MNDLKKFSFGQQNKVQHWIEHKTKEIESIRAQYGLPFNEYQRNLILIYLWDWTSFKVYELHKQCKAMLF